jgi:hypothetical protein
VTLLLLVLVLLLVLMLMLMLLLLLLLFPCMQDLLESPHLTLELTSLMDMLPKNLDGVSEEAHWLKELGSVQVALRGCFCKRPGQ